jgi:hypothetical protein
MPFIIFCALVPAASRLSGARLLRALFTRQRWRGIGQPVSSVCRNGAASNAPDRFLRDAPHAEPMWPVEDVPVMLANVGFQGTKQTSNIRAVMSASDP